MARIHSTSASNILYGTSDNDSITAHGGNDRIYAGDGNDWIYGGDGADTIHGGNGTDTIVYDNSFTGVDVHLGYGGRGYPSTPSGDGLSADPVQKQVPGERMTQKGID